MAAEFQSSASRRGLEISGQSPSASSGKELKQKTDSRKPPKFYCNKDEIDLDELHALLLYSILGQKVSKKPCWCNLTQWNSVSQSILLIIDTKSIGDEDPKIYPYLQDFKQISIRIAQNRDFYSGLLKIRVPLIQQLSDAMGKKSLGEKLTKLDLLLSPVEMAKAHFPLHVGCTFATAATLPRLYPCDGYKYSRKFYKTAGMDSPIYAIDCEMCETTANKSELSRISVINEKLQVVLDTFVKPNNEITNYWTEKSGITPEIMKNVETNLEQIQEAIEKLMEPDAILCGHVVKNDLDSMKIFHPHVADTDVAFNLSGKKQNSKLSELAAVFLGMTIQQSGLGHCSIEDAFATMRLLQIKLREGQHDPRFGNVMSGWNYDQFKNETGKRSHEDMDLQEPMCMRAKSESKALVCNGCEREITFNCDNSNCKCRKLERISCIHCISQRADQQDAQSAETFIQAIFPSLPSTADGAPTLDISAMLKEKRKKLLWVKLDAAAGCCCCKLAAPAPAPAPAAAAAPVDDHREDETMHQVTISHASDGDPNDKVVREFQKITCHLNILELQGNNAKVDEQIATVIKCASAKALICVLFCDRSDGDDRIGKCYAKIKE